MPNTAFLTPDWVAVVGQYELANLLPKERHKDKVNDNLVDFGLVVEVLEDTVL